MWDLVLSSNENVYIDGSILFFSKFIGKQTKHINHFKIHMRCHKDFNDDINELIESFVPEANNSVIKKQHICSICQRACSSRSNLAVHIRRHNGKMTNFCNICGKGYPRSTDLTVHMRLV